jgi:hypothetical protein
MLIKEEKGAALVLTILFLLVGTTLLGGLFVSVRGYLNTSVHKEGISKAFHAADSGVELVKANVNESVFDSMNNDEFLSIYEDAGSLKMEFVDSEKLIDFNKFDSNFSDDYKFTIKVKDAANKTLVSTGKYSSSGREYTENIQFQIQNVGSINKNFNIKKEPNLPDENHYNIDGGGNGNGNGQSIEDHIGVVDWEEEGINSFKSFAAKFISDDLIYINEENEVEFRKNKFEQTTTISSSKDGVNILSEGNLEIENHVTLRDSIIVVDGNINNSIGAQTNIINSIIIVSGYVDIKGAASNNAWENPIFLIYGNDKGAKNNTYLNISGAGGGFNVNFNNLPDDFKGGKTIANWEQN